MENTFTPKPLSQAAQNALAEAATRREAQKSLEADLDAKKAAEKGGPRREPTRFADWEKNGRAIDF